jgi:hypothetical protein
VSHLKARQNCADDHPQNDRPSNPPSPKAGRFLGYVGEELIVSGRQPFLDDARELLKRGYDPATP